MCSGVIFGVVRVVCGSTERERLSCDNHNGLGGDWSRGWASSCPTLRVRLELWQREMLLVLVLLMVSQHCALAGVQGGQVKHRGGPRTHPSCCGVTAQPGQRQPSLSPD